MKQYKLLKDLPGYDAGTVFEVNGSSVWYESQAIYNSLLVRDLDKFPEWFEPALPHPPAKKTYWLYFTRKNNHNSRLIDKELDLTPDAAEAVADLLKRLLTIYQMPQNVNCIAEKSDLLDAIDDAKAIQAGSAA